MAKHNKKHKDSVFCDLFGNQIDGKKNFLSLYNAIHGTDLKLENTTIERKIIPQSVYKTFDNDLSMLINGQLIVMVEHQSTINENMPLRFLEYLTRIYEGIIPNRERYNEHAVKIPQPEFYVFYNGLMAYPAEKILKLSDSFYEVETSGTASLELTVKVINIGPGKNLPIMDSCDILNQYCEFVHLIRTIARKGDEESYAEAVREAIRRGVLTDYLRRNATEIINMTFAEYDYELDMQVKYEEAQKEKAIDDAKALLAIGKLTVEEIASCIKLPIEEVQKLAEDIKNNV